jgi:hypothetical protein
MGTAETSMKATSQYAAVPDQDGSHHRVGKDTWLPFFGKVEALKHKPLMIT